MQPIPIPHLDQHAVEPHAEADAAHVVAERRALTRDGGLQLLADGQQADLVPEAGAGGGRDAERPAAALRVARVLPEGFDPSVEEVDAVAEGQLGDVEVVEHGPELADVVDRGEVLEALLVGRCRCRCGVCLYCCG